MVHSNVQTAKAIYKEHIVQQSSLVSNNYRFIGPRLIDETPVLFGSFSVVQLNRHLILHTADVMNLHNMKTQNLLEGDVIKLAIVVNGQAHVSYEHQALQLNKAQPAALIALTSAAQFTRMGKRDEYERTLTLTFSREWLYGNLLDSVEEWRALYDFSQTHLAMHRWTPSRQAMAIAMQVLNADPCTTPLQRLQLETQCMSLIIEAFSSLMATSQEKTGRIPLRVYHRIQEVRDMLESGSADQLSMGDIAKQVNMSESTLQRHFRQTFNMSVFEYLRRVRLQRAMLAMQKDGVGIAQAAHIAGYNSPANFSTALRRAFGVTPGQIKGSF